MSLELQFPLILGSGDSTVAVDYTILDTLKNDITYSIQILEPFLASLQPLANAIDIERSQFVETPDESGFFDSIIQSFQENAAQFSLQLGESFTTTPEYLIALRNMLSNANPAYMSPQLQMLTATLTSTSGPTSVAVPKNLIGTLIPNLLSGLLVKIATNYRCSEFSLAFNWKLIELALQYNAGGMTAMNAPLSSIVAYITNNIEFLRNASSFYETFCTITSDRLQAKLTGAGRFTSAGELNVEEWILKNLPETASEKVIRVKRLANFVMNNAINEIKINSATSLTPIRFSTLVFPTTQDEVHYE